MAHNLPNAAGGLIPRKWPGETSSLVCSIRLLKINVVAVSHSPQSPRLSRQRVVTDGRARPRLFAALSACETYLWPCRRLPFVTVRIGGGWQCDRDTSHLIRLHIFGRWSVGYAVGELFCVRRVRRGRWSLQYAPRRPAPSRLPASVLIRVTSRSST